MTPRQIDRAKILRDALKRLPHIKTLATQKTHPVQTGLELQGHGEPPYVHSFRVDPTTARMVIDSTERIIRRELKKLGVTLPKALQP